MIFDNYVWRVDTLCLAIGRITPRLLIWGRGAAPAVDDSGVGGRRGEDGYDAGEFWGWEGMGKGEQRGVDLEYCGGNYGGSKLW